MSKPELFARKMLGPWIILALLGRESFGLWASGDCCGVWPMSFRFRMLSHTLIQGCFGSLAELDSSFIRLFEPLFLVLKTLKPLSPSQFSRRHPAPPLKLDSQTLISFSVLTAAPPLKLPLSFDNFTSRSASAFLFLPQSHLRDP